MIRVAWTELQFDLVPMEPWAAPEFTGSMHRGALAMALRRLVCVMRRPSCEGCPLVTACVYPRLFETRPDPAAGVMRRYDRAPHPLVLVTSLRGPSQPASPSIEPQSFGVRIFGPDAANAPFLIRAVEEMVERGLGRDRTPFRLESVRVDGHAPVSPEGNGPPPTPRTPSAEQSAIRRWRLLTPMRLSSDGRPLDPERIDGPSIGRAILRRVGLIAQFYGEVDADPDFKGLAAEADRVRLVDPDLTWKPLRRWSSRQGAQQSIGGLVGTLALDFSDAPRLALLADWVPVMHLGKETVMGLGRVVVEH